MYEMRVGSLKYDNDIKGNMLFVILYDVFHILYAKLKYTLLINICWQIMIILKSI